MLDWMDSGCGGGWLAPDDTADQVDVGGAGPVTTWVGHTLDFTWVGPPDTSVLTDLGTYVVSDQGQNIFDGREFLLELGPQGITLQYADESPLEAWDDSWEFLGFRFTDQSLPSGRWLYAERGDDSTIRLGPQAIGYGGSFVQLNLIDMLLPIKQGDSLSLNVRVED